MVTCIDPRDSPLLIGALPAALCRIWGFRYCGNEQHPKWGHCHCADCVDFSLVAARRGEMLAQLAGRAAGVDHALAANHPDIRKPAPVKSDPHTGEGGVAVAGLARFRPDGRCGPEFPAPGSPAFGECDPDADEDQKVTPAGLTSRLTPTFLFLCSPTCTQPHHHHHPTPPAPAWRVAVHQAFLVACL